MQYNEGKNYISKENAYEILRAFAKEYRKKHGEKIPAEIVVVGGGSILLNYGFRDMTKDFDVIVSSFGEVKEIVYKVAEQFNLPSDWMNTDFKKTKSFSDKLRSVSKHKYSFNHNSLEFRTVNDEYLIAMKLVSAREYRNDVSDIIGILIYAKKEGRQIAYEDVVRAAHELYGSPDKLIRQELLHQVEQYTLMDTAELTDAYQKLKSEEDYTNKKLTEIDRGYPGAVTENTIDNIIADVRRNHRKGR